MEEFKLGMVEQHFANLVWRNEPMPIKQLIGLCESELHWKRTTTYTVLKKLCKKGLFQYENGIVTALLSKEEFFAVQSEQFVCSHFNGSLPAFIAAFTARKSLTAAEVEEIRDLIDAIGESQS